DAAALEVCLSGPALRADEDLACVVFGAPFDLSAGRRLLAPGKTFTLRAGEELAVHGTRAGMRAYFCVRGGLGGPPGLGRPPAPPAAGRRRHAPVPGRHPRRPLPAESLRVERRAAPVALPPRGAGVVVPAGALRGTGLHRDAGQQPHGPAPPGRAAGGPRP